MNEYLWKEVWQIFVKSRITSNELLSFPFISCYTFLKDPFKSLRLYWRRISLHTHFLFLYSYIFSCFESLCSIIHPSADGEPKPGYFFRILKAGNTYEHKKKRKTTWIFYLFVHWGIVQFELKYTFLFFLLSFCFPLALQRGETREGRRWRMKWLGWLSGFCACLRGGSRTMVGWLDEWLRFKVRDRAIE